MKRDLLESPGVDMGKRFAFVWDYDISDKEFKEMLGGSLKKGRLDQKWAAVRLIEYGTYDEIKQLLGLETIIQNWSEWRPNIRSESRRRGFDFYVDWKQKHD